MNIFAEPDFNVFYNAGTLILLCGLTDAPFVFADCWLATENILLAAYAAGLGSCLIGVAVPALNEEQCRRELNIPESHTVVAPIIVGVPNGEGPPRTPKEPRVLHWQ
jgi:nitroreductase